ncbi:fungal-specific transcription factor domain-containing protein [Aspergillus navahoensis]
MTSLQSVPNTDVILFSPGQIPWLEVASMDEFPDVFASPPSFSIAACYPDSNNHSPPVQGQYDACFSTQVEVPPFSSTSSPTSRGDPLPATLARHLVDVFFNRVHPFVPLLHKPTLLQQCRKLFPDGQLYPDNVPVKTALVLFSMFALSARFSTHDALCDIPLMERGEIYARSAKKAYEKARTTLEPDLELLHGCILLAFYYYTFGLSSQGWILVGVCVRVAYDLGLSTIDDDEDENKEYDNQALGWEEKESRRRAWWLVWELDTFASVMARKPFAIDRRHRVHLPVSDEDWLSGSRKRSAPLLLQLGKSWQALDGGQNQCERAWYLVANHLFSVVHDRALSREGVTPGDKKLLENDIACLRLSLPQTFGQYGLPNANLTSIQRNWIVGTHILLAVSQVLAARLPIKQSAMDKECEQIMSESLLQTMYCSRLSAIIREWPQECIRTAHPFFACAISPSQLYLSHPLEETVEFTLLNDLTGIVQAIFAEHWPLASIVSKIRELVFKEEYYSPDDSQLARRYPMYFASLSRDSP